MCCDFAHVLCRGPTSASLLRGELVYSTPPQPRSRAATPEQHGLDLRPGYLSDHGRPRTSGSAPAGPTVLGSEAECLSAAGNPRALRVVGHLTSGWSTAGGIRGWGAWTPCVLRDGHSQGLGESKADVDFGACGAVFRVPPCAARKQPQLLRCPPDPGASSACGWHVSPCPQPSAPAASVLL